LIDAATDIGTGTVDKAITHPTIPTPRMNPELVVPAQSSGHSAHGKDAAVTTQVALESPAEIFPSQNADNMDREIHSHSHVDADPTEGDIEAKEVDYSDDGFEEEEADIRINPDGSKDESENESIYSDDFSEP